MYWYNVHKEPKNLAAERSEVCTAFYGGSPKPSPVGKGDHGVVDEENAVISFYPRHYDRVQLRCKILRMFVYHSPTKIRAQNDIVQMWCEDTVSFTVIL